MNPEAANSSTTAVPVTGILGIHGITTTSTTTLTTTTVTDEMTTLSIPSSLISEEILMPFSDTNSSENSSFKAEVDISENFTSIFTNSTTPVTTTSTTVDVPTGCMGHCKILYMKSSDYRKRYDENLVEMKNPNSTLQTTTRGKKCHFLFIILIIH